MAAQLLRLFTSVMGSKEEPTGRYAHSTAVVGDKVYLWAGCQRGMPAVHDSAKKRQFLSKLDVFNVNTSCWEQSTISGQYPLGLQWYCCVSVREDLYYFGGECGHVNCYHNSIYSLNTVGEMRWTELIPTTSDSEAPMKKIGCGIVHFSDEEEDLLFVVGGYGPNPTSRQDGSHYQPAGSRYTRTNEQHMFSLAKKKWISVQVTGEPPPPCSGFSLTICGENRAALYGRNQDDSSKCSHLFIVELTGKHTVHWSNIGASITCQWPQERSRHAAAHLSGSLFVIVGGYSDHNILNDVWLCDTKARLWRKLLLFDDSVAKRYWHSISTVQLGPFCVWLFLFGGYLDKADTAIIQLIQDENKEWRLERVILKKDAPLENNKAYQDMLRKGRKGSLETDGASKESKADRETEQQIQQLQEQMSQLMKDKQLTEQKLQQTESTLHQVQRKTEHLQQQVIHEEEAANRWTSEIKNERGYLQKQEMPFADTAALLPTPGARRPSMGKLIVVKKKDGKKLNIISEIVSCGLVPCRDLATLLLDDDCLVKKLKKDSKDDEEFIRAVFDRWLNQDDDDDTNSGVSCTWEELCTCISDVPDLPGNLAKEIRDNLCSPSV